MSDYIYNTEQEAIEGYDDLLDSEGMVEVGGLIFTPSRVIKECDPTAYRCGFIDFIDSLLHNDEVPDEAEDWSVE